MPMRSMNRRRVVRFCPLLAFLLLALTSGISQTASAPVVAPSQVDAVAPHISSAGGFTDKAGKSITVTHRNQPDKPVKVALSRNISDNPESNVPVFPGDTVIVRRADVVYVVGDVGRPSGFLMDGGSVTVLQAIALAGGTNHTAKLSG